jgi:hypothetical protein
MPADPTGASQASNGADSATKTYERMSIKHTSMPISFNLEMARSASQRSWNAFSSAV